MISKKIFFLIFLFSITFFITHTVKAQTASQFMVDKNFDASGRSQASVLLLRTTSNLYLYVDKDWWETQSSEAQTKVLANLDAFSVEFEGKIYPKLTSLFGSEWRPGIDGDSKITILFHPMKGGATGYFRSTDEYSKLQIPASNEREMMYLSSDYLSDVRLKIFAAHEFTHLITFNQKDRMQSISEEVWLNEGRADYAPALLGYDDLYKGSNIERRVKDFLEKPSDPLIEWQETKYDYAAGTIFINYLVEHYGVNVLADSLHSPTTGILSINEALKKESSPKNFAQIFNDWAIATLLNDCSLDLKYCYLNQNLENLRINPTLNFLPLSGNSSLSVTNVAKNWAANWQKIIGGHGNLTLLFSSEESDNFQVPYVIINKNNTYTINFLKLDKNGKGNLSVKNFGDTASSLIIIPSLQSPIFGDSASYSFTVSVTNSETSENQTIIEKLLIQIESLTQQIAALQGQQGSCFIGGNLYQGLSGNQVRCLQEFLKKQGADIYPEGLVTGYFGNLTKQGVIRFQQRYGILMTGLVGPLTTAKINQLINAK